MPLTKTQSLLLLVVLCFFFFQLLTFQLPSGGWWAHLFSSWNWEYHLRRGRFQWATGFKWQNTKAVNAGSKWRRKSAWKGEEKVGQREGTAIKARDRGRTRQREEKWNYVDSVRLLQWIHYSLSLAQPFYSYKHVNTIFHLCLTLEKKHQWPAATASTL